MIDLEKALLDPSSVFLRPKDVLNTNELNQQQKIEILNRWEYDARELQVADEENMSGVDPDILDEIRQALHKLEGYEGDETSWGTKQG